MGILTLLLVLLPAGLLSWPLGKYLFRVMEPPAAYESRMGRVNRCWIRLGGSALREEQTWKRYLIALLIFNAAMFALCFAVLAMQQHLPLNPDGKGKLEWSLTFNTTASFVTNTNLQHYSGEAAMSYFSQMFALMWLQFVSAATGLAALLALARGLAGQVKVGNFYRDLLNGAFLVLLPLALLVGILLVLGGVPMTFDGAAVVKTLEGATQTICRGPVAAMVAIKQLGTNGGGFFGANSAHPFENPSYYTNLIECIGIIVLPMACVWLFGRVTKRMKHAAVIFIVMALLLIAKTALALYWESAPTAAFKGLAITADANLEGKEMRFGGGAGAVWSVVTTCTSNGSVNCMHDSLNPLTGMIPMIGMWLNSTFGGVGVGLINMFLYIIVGVFICGMMVGRSPEYLRHKVETGEMKLALLALLVHPLLILGGTALFVVTAWGAATTGNPGIHGFSEILYEFSSAAANNGSGFEGLGDNTIPWNIATGIVMLLGRFLPIALPLAIAGMLGAKKPIPETAGTLHTDTPMFGLVMLGSVVFIGALLFLPVAVLGPIAEHLQALAGVK